MNRTGERKFLMKLDVHQCLESRNKTFLASGGRNESNSHQVARIGDKKIFHERDAQHV